MILRFLMAGVLFFIICTGVVFAGGVKPAEGMKDGIRKILEKSLKQEVNIVRMDSAEDSKIKGLKQIRVWMESAYGEFPILLYMSEDGNYFLAGSIFDSAGNNLSQSDIGKIKPKVISESEMQLNDDYRIGPKDAKVRVVLWFGGGPLFKGLFDQFYDIYAANSDNMSIYLKFYPMDQKDINRMNVLTCFKGDEAMRIYKRLLEVAPEWGTAEHIEDFRKDTGAEGRDCNETLVKKDMELAQKFKLPRPFAMFVNGVMLLGDITKEGIGSSAGVGLN